MVNLYNFQKDILEKTKSRNRVAYYMEMGTGKTFVGSEKMKQLHSNINLIICQKSKINDWLDHFKTYYEVDTNVFDLTNKKQYEEFFEVLGYRSVLKPIVGIINYELCWRRKELNTLNNFTLMLDESSLILGWDISKSQFWGTYIKTRLIEVNGFSLPIVTGYMNVRDLKQNLRDHGAIFLKSSEVIDLPEQVEIKQYIEPIKAYKTFKKDSIVEIDDEELVGDNTLKKMLYERQLCGQFNSNKLDSLKEIMESTTNRIIIFYNFTKEKDLIVGLCEKLKKPYSIINGEIKDLEAYTTKDDSITIVQYQAGAMGLNLQEANKIIYFTLPLSSELFEQSKKRIHRIGQIDTCFYYYLLTKGTIEESIYKTLMMRKDYTNELYREGN